jgi:hypothetical protein
MIEQTYRTLRLSLIGAHALVALACGSDVPDAPSLSEASPSQASPSQASPPAEIAVVTEAILLEAKQGARTGSLPLQKFQRELMGVWRTKEFQQGAWVDLIWVMGKERAWHVVAAYADEALTIPLLRWDVVRTYALGRRSTDFTSAYELTWTDQWSSLLASVDNAALFTQIGVADCALTPNVLRDTSTDNCGAPLFPFRECALHDFVELADGRMTFGDPTQGDRCEQHPTQREAWSFERVKLTPELSARLLGF